MEWLIGLGLLALVIWAGWCIWAIISYNPQLFFEVVIACLPMAIACFSIGLISFKRLSATAGGWLIFLMLAAQSVAAFRYLNVWFEFDWREVSNATVIMATITTSLLLAIPGMVANYKASK